MNPVPVALLSLVLAGTAVEAQTIRPTLYERLGGESGVSAIATALIDRVASDPRIGQSFEGTNRRRIAEHLAQQLCQIADGGCRYEGDPMRPVHAGHHISEREFFGMVEALEDILKARGIALPDRNLLLRRLAPLKRDVVNVPADAG